MTESQDCYILLIQHTYGLRPVLYINGTMKTFKTKAHCLQEAKRLEGQGLTVIALNIDSMV